MSEICDGKLIKVVERTPPPQGESCLNASPKKGDDDEPKKVEPDYGYEFLYW